MCGYKKRIVAIRSVVDASRDPQSWTLALIYNR